MDSLPEPIPAATLVLMRPGDAAPEYLMIERGAGMAFAPGALVFPGGRLDPDDFRLGGSAVDAARIAAIRETIEESGIAVALDPAPDEATEAALRSALAAGALLSDLLAQCALTPRLGDLVPFARWCPTFKETRRFDTLFFIARSPGSASAPSGDAGESVHALWTTARAVLDRAEAGLARIIFPTRRNLERLALFSSFEDAAADAERYGTEKIVPWIEQRRDAAWLCIPTDRGYPVTAELLETAKRR